MSKLTFINFVKRVFLLALCLYCALFVAIQGFFLTFELSKGITMDKVIMYRYYNIYTGKTYSIGEFENLRSAKCQN